MLTKEEARNKEKALVYAQDGGQLFNIHRGAGSMTNKKLIEKARTLRGEGFSYSKIGKIMNKSTMTVWRYINAAV
jgi:DNA-binding CsgD family transcriptional regulator